MSWQIAAASTRSSPSSLHPSSGSSASRCISHCSPALAPPLQPYRTGLAGRPGLAGPGRACSTPAYSAPLPLGNTHAETGRLGRTQASDVLAQARSAQPRQLLTGQTMTRRKRRRRRRRGRIPRVWSRWFGVCAWPGRWVVLVVPDSPDQVHVGGVKIKSLVPFPQPHRQVQCSSRAASKWDPQQ